MSKSIVFMCSKGGCQDKNKVATCRSLHSQPISKMEEYAEYVRRLAAIGAAPQRGLEPQAARTHAFGNPFKIEQKEHVDCEMSAENASNNSIDGNKEARQERRPDGKENRIGRRSKKISELLGTGSETSSISSEISDLSSVAEADNKSIEKEESIDDDEDILCII
uniref:Uncharacterized protein n=1 Tax=Ditylenchus dipsaci TaxID=166011 RepID=A0A915DMZ0_9BILA